MSSCESFRRVISGWDLAYQQYMALVDFGVYFLPSPNSYYRLVSFS